MKKSQQLNVRLEVSMMTDLELISEVEGVGMAELVRGWIRERIAGYQKDRRYLNKKEGRNFLRRKELLLLERAGNDSKV